jgi:hypothetical protein
MTDPLTATANQLAGIQRRLRGTVPWKFEGKTYPVTGPYDATDENEGRAITIIALRKEAARRKEAKRHGDTARNDHRGRGTGATGAR